MRFIEIDGKTYDVACCNDCPCFNETGGDSWEYDECKRPQNEHRIIRELWEYGPGCPLRDKDESTVQEEGSE